MKLRMFLFILVAAPLCAADVSLNDIWLYSSGVGVFEYTGTVSGDDQLRLRFPSSDMADIVRSLTVQDLDGGSVEIAQYDAAESLSRRLQRYAIDISGNPSYLQIASQIRGHSIAVQMDDGTVFDGQIISTEKDDERQSLTLRVNEQIRRVDLSRIDSLTIRDERVQSDLEEMVRFLSEANLDEWKTVAVAFAGSGTRRVSARFIRAMPVWKTSYRIALTEEEATLQGWAHIDNTTEGDWDGVNVHLIAGSPSSFFMDLYSPIYRNRPTVAYETGPTVVAPAYRAASRPERSSFADSAAAPMASMLDSGTGGERIDGGVAARARTSSVGAFSRYDLDQPVSIARGSAAMIPIVNREVQTRRVSVFDRSVSTEYPLAGAAFTNDSGVMLPPGPLTVFDRGSYAGDARIGFVSADEEQLFSFAVDLRSSVTVDERRDPEEIVTIRVVDGIIEVARRSERRTTYTAENRDSVRKTIAFIHPRSSGWALQTPAATETTSASYRFERVIAPDREARITVVEQFTRDERVSLSNLSDGQVEFYVSQRLISPAVRRAFETIRDLRRQLTEKTAVRDQLERERASIFSDQTRIRGNLEQLERNNSLYRRYVATLDNQEDRLVELEDEIADAREAENRARNALTGYVRDLTVR